MGIFKKAAFLLLSAVILLPGSLAAQEAEVTEIETVVDIMFSEYIELENRILLEETNLDEKLYEIRKLKIKAEEANRRDLLSRLEMLTFIVNTRLEEERRETEAESILEKILTDEQRRLETEERKDGGAALTAAALGTTLASGMLFLGSSLIYEDFYSKYIAADNADQAAFYLFWWQTGKTASIITGWSTAAGAVASGIISLLF